ncbi:MAG: hypothetical protein KDK89_11570 [Alphaproteobacteria bacterium]|nr:hypothetical protein [Alphaproteobacteria bacterium]
MSRLYWIIASLFVAMATHAGFILFVPTYSFSHSLAQMISDSGSNKFLILPRESQVRLFPAYPDQSVVGICAFDVSRQNVQLTAQMPAGYWTLTIYSGHGDALYTANNTQAGTNNFTVGLSLAPGLVEMLQQSTEKETLSEDTGWSVQSTEARGIIVLWSPVVDAAQRPGIVKQMQATSCSAVS